MEWCLPWSYIHELCAISNNAPLWVPEAALVATMQSIRVSCCSGVPKMHRDSVAPALPTIFLAVFRPGTRRHLSAHFARWNLIPRCVAAPNAQISLDWNWLWITVKDEVLIRLFDLNFINLNIMAWNRILICWLWRRKHERYTGIRSMHGMLLKWMIHTSI